MRKSNPRYKGLEVNLEKAYRKSRSKLWLKIMKTILKSKRRRVTVNLSKISRHGDEGRIIIVPGKVLGAGKIDKRFNVAALMFSQTAKEKIEEAGGKAFPLESLLEKSVKEKTLQLIG